MPGGFSEAPRRTRFGGFELNLETTELRRGDAAVRLRPLPARLLRLLVSRAGRLVTHDELCRELWGETIVDYEQGLHSAIRQVRAALGDSAAAPRFIETVPRHGYRFIARIDPAEAAPRRRRHWGAVAAVIGAVVLAGAGVERRALDPPASRGRPMVAVLPFEDTGPEPDAAFFTDGLTEELILRLARLDPSRLGVIARTSAMRYRQTQKTEREIGRDLGVEYLVRGRVRRAESALRIHVRLVRATDGSQVWAESYDGSTHGGLELQSAIAGRVAASLAPELVPAWEVTRRPPAAARDAYLRGRYALNRQTRT